MKNEEIEKLIETLKVDFTGDTSYLSGVNDGMYHLKSKLQELNIFDVSDSGDIFAFAVYLTGHDEDTIKQMYRDWH
jgi:hypothetical protein